MPERSLIQRFQRFLLIPPIASCLAALLLFSVCVGILHPRYAINDDLKIIAILAGYPAGNPAPFPIFSNAVLGMVLVPLYALHTSINWEIWLFLAVDIASIWALLFLVLSGPLGDRWKFIIACLILVSASYFALNITFTNAAGLACFAGLCLILASTKSRTPIHATPAVAGVALVLMGSLIRIEMLALTLPLILTALVFLIRSQDLRNLLIAFGCAALVVAAGVAFDRLYVRAHPDWNTYYFYNKTAQQLQDAHRLGNAGLIIKRISWSKNDQELFARSFFPDAGIYSVERIQFLIEHVPGTADDPLAATRAFLESLVAPSAFPSTFLLASLWLLTLARRPSLPRVLAVTAVIVVSLAENAFLAWFYKNPDWVLFTLLANTAMLIVLLLGWPDAAPVPDSTQSRTTHWAFLPWLGLLPALVALAILLNQTVAASNENLSKQLAYRQILADIGRLQSEGQIAPDAIIISPSHGIPWEWSNPLILDFPQIPFLDTGWITFSPFYEGALQHYDLEPLPQAIVGKSNVYLMTKLIFQPFLAQYYQEHEHMAVTFEPIYNIPAAYHAVEYTDTQLYRVVRAR